MLRLSDDGVLNRMTKRGEVSAREVGRLSAWVEDVGYFDRGTTQ